MPLASSSTSTRKGVFRRLAAWSSRHHWWALGAWLVVLVSVTAGSAAVGADYHNDYSLPGTDSQRVQDVLRQHAPGEAGSTVQVVLEDRAGLTAPEVRQRVAAMLGDVRRLDHVTAVTGPYDDRPALSADGRIGYATVVLDGPTEDVPTDAVRQIVDTARSAAGGGLRVELGGDAVVGAEEGGGGPVEGLGILAALIVLAILFGSVLAAALPIVIAVFAVGAASALLVLATHLATVADYTTPLMALVGLGVGIDYALLLLSRYRAELVAGRTRTAAVAAAVDTAGRTVFFAGSTVIIALAGLVVLGLGSLQGVAVAVALTVLLTMVAALTLLPALLEVVGGRIERAADRRAARGKLTGQGWRRWSGRVQRRPRAAILLAGGFLVALCAPVAGMNLGFADAGNGDPASTSRQAYDLLAKGFGPGVNGPLVVVAAGAPGASGEDVAAAAAAARSRLAGVQGVAEVGPVLPSADGRIATLIVYPGSKPQAVQTQQLVARLRADVLPVVAPDRDVRLLVGGTTAATVDFADAVSGRLPWFVAVVVGLSALLLAAVFRSLLIPLKAAVLNLLSIGAALGVVTAVFQHGVLGGLLGVEPGPVEAFVPVLIFAIAFGLSMDYEVFLVSRMHEEWRRSRDAGTAVREGMGTTGAVVTAAAAVMVVVFGSFLADPSRMLKQFGLGLAVAVLLDAFVIRSVLVPAVMQLLGARAWSLPRVLDRLLPGVAIEGPADVRDRQPSLVRERG